MIQICRHQEVCTLPDRDNRFETEEDATVYLQTCIATQEERLEAAGHPTASAYEGWHLEPAPEPEPIEAEISSTEVGVPHTDR